MKFIKLTKKNVESIDCNEVAFYSFAETGAMGVHAGIEIITFDNKKYAGTYAFGDLNITNFYRALPSLKRGDSGKSFEHMYLGMGNNLYVRKEIFDDFVKILNKDIPDYEKNRGEFYKGWRNCADKLLNDYNKPELKGIKPIKEARLNPFKSMGFNIDINDRKTQEKIVKYAEKYAVHNIDAYSYKLYNAYSAKKNRNGIQFAFKRNNKEMTLTEKMDELVVHHTNNCTWDSEVYKEHAEDEFFIKPFVTNGYGVAFARIINSNIEPYIQEGDRIVTQVNCYAYDVRVFKGDERFEFNDNNFHFYKEDAIEPIYMSDNSITLASIFNMDEKYSKLNIVRGDVLRVGIYTSTIFGQKREYKEVIIDTKFGPTPLIFNENVITHMNGDQIRVGDRIEALCSITLDKMLYYDKVKNTFRDKGTYFDVLKRAFEKKDMSYIENILSEDCEYHSDEHDFVGKKTVLEKLQYITNVGYGDKEFTMDYCIVAENPIRHFPLGEEVLCLHFEDGSVEGELNFHMNKKKLIDNIYITNNTKLKFKIYRRDGSLYIADSERPVHDKLIETMEKKGFSQDDISRIMNHTFQNREIIVKMLEFIKSKRNNKKLIEETLEYSNVLFHEFIDKHPNRVRKIVDNIQRNERKEYVPRILNADLD